MVEEHKALTLDMMTIKQAAAHLDKQAARDWPGSESIHPPGTGGRKRKNAERKALQHKENLAARAEQNRG